MTDDERARKLQRRLIISNNASKVFKFEAKQEQVVDSEEKVANGTAPEEVKGKKNKKKSKDGTTVNGSEKTLEDTVMTEKINESHENGNEEESGKTSKASNGDKVPELVEDQLTKKPKEKKKKKKSKLASTERRKHTRSQSREVAFQVGDVSPSRIIIRDDWSSAYAREDSFG